MVGMPSQAGMPVGRQGDDPARHTDTVIVEETQGSPSDRAGVQLMEEDSPEEDRRIQDVHMETLDLGGEDDVQQTQADRAEADMETEAPAAGAVTNARSSMVEEGADLPSAGAPPADDEVTLL